MSIVFSKNKEKRARTSSGESNNSFVKNVTSRVSGLLPATITKWFSSPGSSANGSAPAADATDSSTEDEAPESPVVAPPAKRMRFSPAANYGTDGNCVTNAETIESSTPYTVQSPTGRNTFRRETNFVSTPIRSDETTIERTTIDRTTIDRTTIDRTIERTSKDKDPAFTHTAASIGMSASKKRKSLFGNQSQELSDASKKKAHVQISNNTVRESRPPSFNPTLLGSPFYAGRTTYGGAASSYINQPNISHRQTATVNEAPSTSDNNMSTSARRILELLESYSSPLMDAKRIPHYTRPTRQEILKRHSESSALSSPYSKPNSYRTQELHVPSIASVLRLKQRSRLNDSTNAARQLIASHSSSSPDYLSYPAASKRDQSETDGNNKLTTKVKSRLTRPNRGEANAMDSETMTPVELPKAVLQIDPNNLPNFSIPISPKTSTLGKPATSTPLSTAIFARKTASTEKSKSESITSSSIYNFAHPVRITSESPKPTSKPPKYTFVSPERSIDKPPVSEKSSEPFNLLGASKETPKESDKKSESADWSCPDCWVKNKGDAAQCVCCGHKHNATTLAKPAKCSLCKLADTQPNSDKCVNCAKVQLNNISKPLKADTSAKWTCKDCWVSNEDSATKCVCCGAANPRKETTQTAPAKKPEGGGMCSKCFSIKNSDGTCSKCAPAKPDASFTIVLKSQANKWECEHCLVRNDTDKTRCVCCEAERSGKPKQPEKKQFNFGTVNTTFKFGIDPKLQEANLAKAAEKPAEIKDKVEESETNNNVLPKAPPTFSFGIPAKKSEDQPDAAKDKIAEAPKVTFNFGLPNQNSVTSTPASMFGIPNKLTEAPKEAQKEEPEKKKAPEEKEKPQEPKAAEPAKPRVMMFGQGSAMADKLTSPAPSATFNLKKDASNTPSTSATPAMTFTAPTTSAEEPATGLFGAIATTAPATTISFAPPAATSALSMFQKTDESKPVNSIFQKTDTPVTSAVSPFQKTDAPAATAAPATNPAPMFSFGNSQTTTGDKPSFNFTFSSSTKSDMFKPPTFAATDSSTTVSKFSLGSTATENPLAAANPLGGNGLSANSLTNNALTSGNGLSVNPLTAPGNGLPASSGLTSGTTNIFGAAVQKENAWSPPNNSATNPFNANATTNAAPKPFSFGSSTPFSANPPPAFGSTSTQNSTPAFGGNLATSTPAFGAAAQPAAVPAFGAPQSTPAPAFGSTQSSSNIFGAANQNSQSSMFTPPSQRSTGMFGSPQQPAAGSMPPPSVGMFGRPSVGAAPTFGTPNPSIPTFEAPSLPAQAPSFNFGTPQTSFQFGGQQQQPPQAPGIGGQTGVYSFGAGGGQTQVQFSMGSAPNAGVRRVRRAVRRSTQR